MSAAHLTRRFVLAMLALAALLWAAPSSAPARGAVAPAHGVVVPSPRPATDFVPDEVLVGYASAPPPRQLAHAARQAGDRPLAAPSDPATRVVKVGRGQSVWQAIRRLRRQRGVLYAVPNYIAHAAGWIPNDPGNTRHRQGWQSMQWNFLPGVGVDAPAAWGHMFGYHRPGGRGVVVAVLDTGVAYRDWDRFRKAPDFSGTRFIDPYDFVAHNPYPLDREGHGTFVAGMIAETTNNRVGLTGLAYGAAIMPIRVLDADGNGDAATIARGIRYAVAHGAQVINLSLEFDITVTASDIPDIISAVRFAHRHGVVVVAAAGNDSSHRLAYPAAAPAVVSVGASTRDGCLAGYSNGGDKLDLVAPGGGDDATLNADPNCHPFRNLPPVHQMTFSDFDSISPGANAARFGLPASYGTSMAAPQVSATAALVIASRVLGRHPSPDRVLAHLEHTATPLGGSQPNPDYGWGLVNAGAATERPSAAAAR